MESLDKNNFVIENDVLTGYNGDDEEIVIPNGIKKIDMSVFTSCISLKKATIAKSVKFYGEVFDGSDNVEIIRV